MKKSITSFLGIFFILLFNLKAQGPCTSLNYGASGASSTGDEEIFRVSVGTMNNISNCATTAPGAGSINRRYSNYTGFVVAPQLTPGQLAPWLVQVGTCGGWYGMAMRIYIDWNQNGSFLDANEMVVNMNYNTVTNGNNTGNFTVPLTALAGFTRMRIIAVEGSISGPTGSYTWGETEDYCVQVMGAPCSGSPNAGLASITSTMGCPNTAFALNAPTATGGLGITYQWYESSNANGPWTAISNATTSSTNYSVANTTYFQMVVTCTNSNQSATTSVVSYSMNNPGPCVCTSYGSSGATLTGDEEIFTVAVGNMVNNSNCNTTAPGPGSSNQLYSNYAGFVQAPDMCQGSTQNFTVALSTCGGWYGVQYRIYIDWDQNGLFTGPNEMVANVTTGVVQGVNTGTFVVPAFALPGLTRMRVIAVEGTVPGPTGSYTWGETEDYCVNVLASPVLSASGGSVVCGNPFTITPNGANTYTYISSLGGANQTGSSITFTPLTNVNYTVIGTGANNCTASINNIAVNVQAPSFLTVTPQSATVCPLAQTQFSATGANSYTWQGGVNTASAALTASAPLSTINYTLIAADAIGCINFATVAVSAYPNPTVNITSTAAICNGGSATLTSNGAINYTWSNTQNGSTTVVSPTITTTYSIIGEDAQTCTTTAQYQLLVKPIPVLTITANQNPFCKGQNGLLTVLGAASYTWGTGSTANTTTIAPQNSGYYSVVAMNTVNCTKSDSVFVSVFIPTVSISGPSVICSGQPAVLAASSADTYSWSNNWNGQVNSVFPNTSTIYSLTVSATSNNISCASNPVSFTVQVSSTPTISAQISAQSVCKLQTFIMSASGANSYSWSTGATTASVSLNEAVPGVYTYFVTGTSTAGCLSNKVNLGITVNSCTGIDEYENEVFTVYPNPGQGIYNFVTTSSLPYRIQVLDITGRILIDQELHTSNYTLNLQAFANGIYYFNVISAQSNKSLRIIKE